MLKLFRYTLLALAVLVCSNAMSQDQVVHWSSKVESVGGNDFRVTFTANIAKPWHMYDMGPYDGGPNPTVFTIGAGQGVELIGKIEPAVESTRIYDEIFEMEIGYYTGRAEFYQTVRVTAPSATIRAYVEWMVCDEGACLPPEDKDFIIEIRNPSFTAPQATVTATGVKTPTAPAANVEPLNTTEKPADTDSIADVGPEAHAGEANAEAPQAVVAIVAPGQEKGKSLWGLIIEAILWGFAALLTPCVFPMVPMTVSFFMKGSENKSVGRFRAAMYGLFIVLLYTVPIAAIIVSTRIISGEAVTADIFNWLATHWLPNIIFFLVFMVFAASFFGAFEITMPSRLVNRSDRKSDRGGLGGIFFMALTLVLVSFSCTGPIVGSVLIKSTQGEFWEPVVTMLAFSVAFALPFTLLAFFPSLLTKLKSGSWLNSVKVVLGFVELALGLKFLSVADQTYHWGILDREIYLALWIVIFTLLGFYLLGKIKFKHDSDVKHIGIGRLGLSIVVFTFVVYMIPGMWGAPLKALSGYLPPIATQDFVLEKYSPAPGNSAPNAFEADKRKYSDFLHLPHNLEGFFDFEEGLRQARRENKPLLVDFTGHGCVNCREMEARVWSDPQVLQLLREQYVIVALYSDDKKNAMSEDWITTASGRQLKGIGKINSYFVKNKFGVNAQPSYIIVGRDGEALLPPRGYDLDTGEYVQFLRQGIQAYKNSL